MVKDRETWRAAVPEVTKNQTRLSNWTTAFTDTDDNELLLNGLHICEDHEFQTLASFMSLSWRGELNLHKILCFADQAV